MQAIQTKFFGWNAARQSYRVKASAAAGSVWVQFGQVSATLDKEHEAAARALLARFGWNEKHDITGGTMPDGTSRVWVLVPKPEPERIEWTRIKNDINGNGRIVCHFLHLNTRAELDRTGEDWIPTGEKYRIALARAHTIGGRKFNNKQYGGGIVFTGDISEIEAHIVGVTQ